MEVSDYLSSMSVNSYRDAVSFIHEQYCTTFPEQLSQGMPRGLTTYDDRFFLAIQHSAINSYYVGVRYFNRTGKTCSPFLDSAKCPDLLS